MRIGIIGAGNIGSALAMHFRKLQHTVQIANSRGPETLSQLAQKTGATPVALSGVGRGSRPALHRNTDEERAFAPKEPAWRSACGIADHRYRQLLSASRRCDS